MVNDKVKMKMKSKKPVRDAEKVIKEFFAAVDARKESFNASDAFVVGYLKGFLKMNADERMLDAMESRINAIESRIKSLKDAA
jgi:hypothetical protein